eukprot:TRINITY_DN4313_c0_g2_i1.p1 TRINITY_DN4313_c0_g2~~TRINITY_DN4313_c0_g2_i1.p1  ORF type:complete len:360 (-),score=37.05 TRINITY_DN4313_c0_g2_i1:168-1247(-)
MQNNDHNPYLKNTWYIAALSSEIDDTELFPRTLLEIPVLIYRKQDGTPVAIHDRCPHRFAPLHRGWREGDEVVCQYHALRFDCSGQCTHNPHGNGTIPKAAQVQSFPLVERDGFIWIWMGGKAADYEAVQDYSELVSGHPNSVGYTYMAVEGHYELIIDNVMDLSHIDHVHGEIISTRGKLTPLTPHVEENGNEVIAHWQWSQQPAMLIFNQFLPDPDGEARHFFNLTWTPPANIQLSVGATQNPDSSLDLDGTIGQYDLHAVTPESQDRTHYFFATRRNHKEDDAEYNDIKIKAMHQAFEDEDLPIIEAVHHEMGTSDFFSLKPVLMSNDVAPVRVRRKLAKLIADEQPQRIPVEQTA